MYYRDIKLVWFPNSFLPLFFFFQGVYRVSGSKPRILKLCQAFECQKDQVDLSDLSPHDITSILKHFFKEVHESLPNHFTDWIKLIKSPPKTKQFIFAFVGYDTRDSFQTPCMQ